MSALNPSFSRRLPAWWSVPIWLAVFVSPTIYVLLLIVADRLHVPAPSEGLVVLLFCLIPVVALLFCGAMVWRAKKSLAWRVGGLALTLVAMLLQCGVWFVIIMSAISVAIAPAQ